MLTKPALLALYTPMFVFVIMVHRRRRRIVPGSSRNDMFPDVRMHDIHYAFFDTCSRLLGAPRKPQHRARYRD